MAGYKNFEVKRNKATNTVGVFDKTRSYNISEQKFTKSERLMNGVAEWCAFYRSRPDIFAEEYMGLSLKPFQKILLYCMIHYNYTMFLASRGLGKTWLTALYCVIRCILYPGTKIIVAGGKKGQAMKVVTEKIPELISKSKTGMLKREIKGSIRTSMNTDDPNVEFMNGSWIKVVAANQNARSARANILVLDEFRMIDPSVYKNVLRRFLATSRQPGFLDKSEYKNKQEYLERNQEIFLSSCWFKFNWSYERYKVFINAMLKGKKYFVCGLPYQFAIKENITNREQLLDELAEEDLDEIGWTMEMDCLFFGESEKAFFKTEELSQIRKQYRPIYPKPTYELIKDKKFKYIPKEDGEIRILSCDIATIGTRQNDASVYMLMQLFPIVSKKNENEFKCYKRVVSYMETMTGGHSETQAIRIRQLYDDLDCDYIVLDRQGNGIGVYDNLCKRLYDRERGIEYAAFNSMNEEKMQERCLVPNAERKIYTISATAEFNSEIAVLLKDTIKRNRLELLVNSNDSYEYLSNIENLIKQTPEIQAKMELPYNHTDALVNEMVLLECEQRDNGIIKLKEKAGQRKDRYSALAYSNYFASILEKDLIKQDSVYDFVFSYN
ncbi:MAG TPA: terminase family protein [Bacilli bacterium]|nr:terminase family protein [Bacilli bacterium]